MDRCCNYYKIGIPICSFCIQRCRQIQIFFCKIFLNIIILDWRFAVVDHLCFFRSYIHCCHLMMLAQIAFISKYKIRVPHTNSTSQTSTPESWNTSLSLLCSISCVMPFFSTTCRKPPPPAPEINFPSMRSSHTPKI